MSGHVALERRNLVDKACDRGGRLQVMQPRDNNDPRRLTGGGRLYWSVRTDSAVSTSCARHGEARSEG